MRITVNGAPLAIDVKEGGRLGELLSGADDLLDKAGSVIVSLKVDGEEVDAEGYSRFAARELSSVEKVEIRAEDAAAIRVRAIGTLLELLAIAKRSAEDTAAEDTAAEDTAAEDTAAEDTAAEDTAAEDTAASDWAGLRAGAKDMRDAFAGLFAADELSFVQLFADILDRVGDSPDKASRVELSAQADRLASVFGERLAELRFPVGEMRTAAALFEARSSELAELPVLLQTGKEDQAMKAVLYFIEIFNKVIRIIPELRRSGVDTSSISVGGSGMPEFYGAFNEVLRELTEAFEHKDAVLIGDLAEYEVLPRMRSFFTAMEEALPES
jgi:pyruvate/2-oxoglutarate dehydrogenase complex dihydrolipoamide acyltransferase (E2) component